MAMLLLSVALPPLVRANLIEVGSLAEIQWFVPFFACENGTPPPWPMVTPSSPLVATERVLLADDIDCGSFGALRARRDGGMPSVLAAVLIIRADDKSVISE
jgi:hypothetical protein